MEINYQEKIRQHDASLYEAIFPYIHEIPDFRPQETVKKMKGSYVEEKYIPEAQNNWRLIAEELEALGYKEEHQRLLDCITQNDVKTFRIYFLDDLLLYEFFQSYPGIIWLLRKISPEECTWALYLSQNEYLDDIPMKQEYVFISSFNERVLL